jgi:hypothetical protein
MKKQASIIAIVLAALATLVFLVWNDAQGGGGCQPFARWERPAGSMSLFPERGYGDREIVTLLDCDGLVRVERELEEITIQRRAK